MNFNCLLTITNQIHVPKHIGYGYLGLEIFWIVHSLTAGIGYEIGLRGSSFFRNNDVQKYPRTWLVFSAKASAFYCLPCRLFPHDAGKGLLASQDGWTVKTKTYQKLYNRIRDHESSSAHTICFTNWKVLQKRFKNESSIDHVLIRDLKTQQAKWEHIFRAILDVVLFLSERGLAFRGSVDRIGDRENGNFLGLLELIGKRDPLLALYLENIKKSQQSDKRLQAHYLSPVSQNEFLSDCGNKVQQAILSECRAAQFFSILVDATPDASHQEQQTFILRYLKEKDDGNFEIVERFLQFLDCDEKTGAEISKLILHEIDRHGLNKDRLRGQGYDNGSNMSGKFKGCQALILEQCPLALFSSCSLHSLNLVGVDSAKCSPTVITFFGSVQKLYTLFSGSPKRWEILKSEIGESLHGQSETRWSARVDSVKPFAAHLTGLLRALNRLDRNTFPSLTSANLSDINGLKKYLSSYVCVIMSSIWFKVLKAIDIRNQIVQRQNCTLDVAVKNVDSLLQELIDLREHFESIVNETSHVAAAMDIDIEFPKLRHVLRVKRGAEEMPDKERFKFDVFYLLLDNVISGITERFRTMHEICQKFSFLWLYRGLSESEIETAATKLGKEYCSDLKTEQLVDNVKRLRTIHDQTFGKKPFTPLDLFNQLHDFGLVEIFSEVTTALEIFLTIPVSVASGERSFSKLKLIKSVTRSTMKQDRLNNLAVLNLNSEKARSIDFSDIVRKYSYKQVARNSNFFS